MFDKANSIMLFSFLGILSIPLRAQTASQKEKMKGDTIYVNSEQKTRILMPLEVEYVDPGDLTSYKGEVIGSTVRLQAIHSEVKPNLLLIGMGGNNILQATIAYKKFIPVKDLVQDLRDIPKERYTGIKKTPRSITEASDNIDRQVIDRRIGLILGSASERSSLGARTDKMEVVIEKLMKDDSYFYIRLNFSNKSKSEYKVEAILFGYGDKNENTSRYDYKYVTPVGKEEKGSIPVKESKIMVYALDRYNLGKKGHLKISIKENQGSREMEITVPYNELLNSEQF